MQTIYAFYLSLLRSDFVKETVYVLCVVGINLQSSEDYVRSVCLLMPE